MGGSTKPPLYHQPSQANCARPVPPWRGGGRSNDPACILCEQDFNTWTPADLDKYKPSADWAVENPKPRPPNLETWRRNAINRALIFSHFRGHVPGAAMPRPAPRHSAIERRYRMHLSNPNKYTLKSPIETWGKLNARWVDTLTESSTNLCMLRKSGRPTIEALKETGMSIDSRGRNIFSIPHTSNLGDPVGYGQHQVSGALERDYDRPNWDPYYKKTPHIPTRNAGRKGIRMGRAYRPWGGESGPLIRRKRRPDRLSVGAIARRVS